MIGGAYIQNGSVHPCGAVALSNYGGVVEDFLATILKLVSRQVHRFLAVNTVRGAGKQIAYW